MCVCVLIFSRHDYLEYDFLMANFHWFQFEWSKTKSWRTNMSLTTEQVKMSLCFSLSSVSCWITRGLCYRVVPLKEKRDVEKSYSWDLQFPAVSRSLQHEILPAQDIFVGSNSFCLFHLRWEEQLIKGSVAKLLRDIPWAEKAHLESAICIIFTAVIWQSSSFPVCLHFTAFGTVLYRGAQCSFSSFIGTGPGNPKQFEDFFLHFCLISPIQCLQIPVVTKDDVC